MQLVTTRAVAAVALLSTTVVLGGCAPASGTKQPAPPAAGSTTVATAAPTPEETQEPAPEPTQPQGAVEAYLAWLAASRVPDVDAACAALSPDLQARIIAELNAGGATQVSTCAEMIAATAALYQALGQTAEVDVDVQSETATDATLFVTYADSGSCGTVVMTRPTTEWILTEQSQECAGS